MKKVIITLMLLSLIFEGNAQGLKTYLPAGKYLGIAISDAFINDTTLDGSQYGNIVTKHFNTIVAENAFKMDAILFNVPADPLNLKLSDLNLTKVDKMLAFAQSNNMRVRGHSLIWYNQIPPWLSTMASGWTSNQIYQFSQQYISLLTGYCKGKVQEWDVVNEFINDNSPSNYRAAESWYVNVSNIQDFIDQCFICAHTADPNALLFYNDYNIETNYFPKNAFMLSMVQGMINRHVPINGVGVQSHFTSGPDLGNSTLADFEATIDNLNSMGLKCNISELDIRICNGVSNLQKQGIEYKRFTEIFLKKSNVNTLLLWGVTDKYSWVLDFFPGCDKALIFDKNYSPKLGYFNILQALKGDTTTITQMAYQGIKMQIPGKIEVENYDLGSQNISYYDSDNSNQGGNYRDDEVDIAADATGYVLAYTATNEWLEYTVDVVGSTSYNITISASSGISNGSATIRLSIDGTEITAPIAIGNTGAWNSYHDFHSTTLSLSKGTHVLRLLIETTGANIDYILFQKDLSSVYFENKNSNNISIYPNPSSEYAQLNIVSNQNEAFTISIHDLLGKNILIQNGNLVNGQNTTQLNTNNFLEGTYIVKVNSNSLNDTFLLIIKK